MRIVFAAGGTGGHINPALAVAGELKKRDQNIEILFIGTSKTMEARLVPKAGFDFMSIDITGFHRSFTIKNIFRNFATVYKMFKSSKEAKQILQKFRPDVVIGFGGYVSGPVVRAAHKLGIKTAIHEQNAYPGLANKALAKTVDLVLLATEGAKDHLNSKNEPIVAGLPIRAEIVEADRDISRMELGLDDRPMILSTGGSLGAKVFNEAMVDLISHMYKSKKCYFIHGYGQHGMWVPQRLKERGVDLEKEKHLMIKEYIYDMPRCLAAADIIINRAGASTLTEIQAQGLASILIPSPNVTENHQFHNASTLSNRGAAIIIEEKDLTSDHLIKTVEDLLLNEQKRKEIGKKAKQMYVANAQKIIADKLTDLVRGNL